MSLNSAMQNAASGLTAERFRMDVISGNLANANTSKVGGEDPYQRRIVELQSTQDGVEVTGVVNDTTPFKQKVDWGDPNHDPKTGMVQTSNVEPVVEMVDMLSASRAYEANVQAFNAAKDMVRNALDIGKA